MFINGFLFWSILLAGFNSQAFKLGVLEFDSNYLMILPEGIIPLTELNKYYILFLLVAKQ